MTDRHLAQDMAAHARRAAGLPEPGLREQLEARMDALLAEYNLADVQAVARLICAEQAELDATHDRARTLVNRLKQVKAERDALRTVARSTAAALRDTAERAEAGRTVNAKALRAQAAALDEITEPKETR